MLRKQKVGLESSSTRALLLDTAELLMVEEGYAAVTSRRLGNRAGVKPQLVHYYFPTMDDLFLSLYRRHADSGLASVEKALSTGNPLKAIWQHSCDETFTRLHLEFQALANHRKVICVEMTKHAERYREIQLEAVQRFFGITTTIAPVPPEVMIVLLSSAGMLMSLEKMNMVTFGHAQTENAIEQFLDTFAGPAKMSVDDPAPGGSLRADRPLQSERDTKAG